MASLSAGSTLAQPAAGDGVAEALVAACTGLTWAELVAAPAGYSPRLEACDAAVDSAFALLFPPQQYSTLPYEEQTRVGLAIGGLMNGPVEAGAPANYAAAASFLSGRLEGGMAESCAPVVAYNFYHCYTAFLLSVAAGLGYPSELVPQLVQNLCAAMAAHPEHAEVFASNTLAIIPLVVGEFPDPATQARLAEIGEGIGRCT